LVDWADLNVGIVFYKFGTRDIERACNVRVKDQEASCGRRNDGREPAVIAMEREWGTQRLFASICQESHRGNAANTVRRDASRWA
jgi:hypothetical protein